MLKPFTANLRTPAVQFCVQLIATFLLPALSIAASSLTWDADGTAGGSTGGTGDWNTTSLLWNKSGSMVAWINANSDIAIFGGTAGTVTLTESVTAGGLTFNTDGYTLVGNGNTLTFGGTITVTNTATQALLQSNITLAAGTAFTGSGNMTLDTAYSINGAGFNMSKSGTGTLNLKGTITDVGTLTLSGGTTNLSGSYVRTSYSTSYGLTVSSGTFNVTGTLGTAANPTGQTAFQGGSITNFSGTAYLSGASSTLRIGENSSATVNVTAGTLTVGAASGGLVVGRTSTSGNGYLNISGGTVNVTSSSNVIRIGAGYTNTENSGASIMTISGTGLFDSSTTLGNIQLGSGLSGNTTSSGTINMDGGTLATNRNIMGGSVGTSIFNFNGGTLKANGTAMTLSTGLTTVNVRNGGAVIDTNNFAVTIAKALTHSSIGGDNTTDGGLTKNGLGILTLSGTDANTYTGITLINVGELDLSKTAGINAIAGSITIGNGTTTAMLKLLASDQIADTSVITLIGSGIDAGVFRLNGKAETIGGLISTGGAGIVENEAGSAVTSTLTVNVDSGSQTFSGTLRNGDGTGTDGTLAFTKAGAGTLTLSGTNTYTGATTINMGTLILTGTSTYAGSITINGGMLTLDSTNTFSNSTLINAGTLLINTANIFSGSITITAGGTLQFGTSNAISSTPVLNLTGAGGGTSATFALSGYNWTSGAINFYDATSGATSLGTINIGSGGVLTMGGTLTVNSTNNPLGALITGGTLDLGTATRTFAVGDSSNAAHDLTIASAITSTSGAFGITKTGLGNLLLSGSVNIAGNITVASGVLEVTGTLNNGASGTSVGSVSAPGMLRLSTGADYTTTTLGIGNATSYQGTLVVSGGTLTLTTTNTQAGITLGATGYGGMFLSSGTINTKRVDSGDGTTPASISVLQVSGGTLNTANYIMFRNERWEFTVTGGQVLRTGEYIALGFRSGGSAITATTTAQGAMTMAGGLVNNAGLSITIGQQNNNLALGTAYLNLNAGTLINNQIVQYNGTGAAINSYINFNGGTLQASVSTPSLIVVSGTGGTGTLTAYVNGAFGTFNGGAVINTAGFNVTIPIAMNTPTGNGVTSIAISDGGSGYYGAPYVEISGGGGSGATAFATVDLDPTSPTYGKLLSITISNPGIGYTSTPTIALLGGGGSGVVLGTINTATNTSGGLTKSGLGTLTLSGADANTFTGTSSVNAGALELSKTAGVNAIAGDITLGDGTTGAVVKLINSDQIADTSVITFNGSGANAGIFRLNNKSETIGGLSSTVGAGIVENESGSAATSTLTVNVATGSQTYSGTLRNGDGSGTDGTLAFTKTGAGTQVLTGSNTYTGTTTISDGALQAGSSGSGTTGTGAVTVQTGGTLLGTGFIKGTSFTASSGAIVQAGDGTTQSNYGTLTFAPLSGSGALNFQSGSTVILGIHPGSTSDLLNIVGTGTNTFLFNGNLTVTADAFTPTAPEVFNLLDWSGLSLSPTFANRFTFTSYLTGNGDEASGLDLPDISGSGYLWDISSFTTNGTIAIVVPEPSRLLLLGLALGLMLIRRKR
ncbi:autotransporter-associated beta strand repeat-containing protein [Prosthecobacter sp.]|uniref:beta strand repeat-containing protein n=1 Tax=Prosthecobacter sp. TaxID=1965333 RepID=UPI00248A2A5C|nr:autotransporter-associated beta strand repeat-containing protein [Prosthecobacter sp.]MDI1313423.1 autotransporter-associated beta strand repeat-containing protein [Prosthecobacter sp.]